VELAALRSSELRYRAADAGEVVGVGDATPLARALLTVVIGPVETAVGETFVR